MVERFYQVIEAINSIVWGLPVIILLVSTGIFLTIRLKFIQARKFKLASQLVLQGARKRDRSEKEKGDITPFQALLTELGGIIGTGNIAGVATAIALGGPGAIFWMWVSAIFGMATKYSEVVLGLKYRVTAPDGTCAGGPMYYLRNGLGSPLLGGIFAFMLVVGNFFTSPLMQTNSIALVFNTEFGISKYITTIIIVITAWAVIIGGIKSIAKFMSKTVPLMVVLYVVGGLGVIAYHYSAIAQAFKLIVTHAFTATAATGGFIGCMMRTSLRYGIARGVMSNEAGIGTAAIIHGAAKTREPVKQGLISLWAVFVNTMIVCTMSGLVTVVSGKWTTGLTSSALVASSFNAAFPRVGGIIVVISLVLFGFTSLISGAYTGGQSCEFFLGSKAKRIYYWILCGMMFVGGIMKVEAVWSVGDIINGSKIVFNVIGLIGLSGVVVAASKDFFARFSNRDLLNSGGEKKK